MTGKRAGHGAECWNIPRDCSQQAEAAACVKGALRAGARPGEGDE